MLASGAFRGGLALGLLLTAQADVAVPGFMGNSRGDVASSSAHGAGHHFQGSILCTGGIYTLAAEPLIIGVQPFLLQEPLPVFTAAQCQPSPAAG